MKTRFYWVALFTSAALIVQAQAGGHHSGGFAMAPHAAPAFHSAPHSNFGGGRFASGPRFSTSRAPMAFREQRFVGSDRAFARSHQFARTGDNHRIGESRTIAGSANRFTRNGQASGTRFENRGASAARRHVFARRTATWHRDWDRHRDHFWNGHRCRFVNGEWFIYDTGFYPYDSHAYLQIDGVAVTLDKRLALSGSRYSGGGVTLKLSKAAVTIKHANRPTTACAPL